MTVSAAGRTRALVALRTEELRLAKASDLLAARAT